jgi:RNA polymerase sigma-70 factor (ECF subfamily)
MSTPSVRLPHADGDSPADAADSELVRASQASRHAFAALYRRYRDSILKYCYYRLGEWEEAEDAASAIFVKALDHLPHFAEHGDSFRSWLFSIAHNEITDRYRRRQRRAALTLSEARDLPDPAASPEEIALAGERRTQVATLLALVPARERAVLELRAADCNTREIAQILRISEQNVRTAQSRALSRLRGLVTDRAGHLQETIHA